MRIRKKVLVTAVLFVLFAVFTAVVSLVDVRPIGPQGTSVGLSSLNGLVRDSIGANTAWYRVTNLLGIVAIVLALGFAASGGVQLIKRKSLIKVDCQILLLGIFYVIVAAFYVFFEIVIVNYRPVILDTDVEASYPSSHTVLIVCVMSTAIMELRRRLTDKKVMRVASECLAGAVIAVTVVGRMLSGVHWFTDIVAGCILSAALVMLYATAVDIVTEEQEKARQSGN